MNPMPLENAELLVKFTRWWLQNQQGGGLCLAAQTCLEGTTNSKIGTSSDGISSAFLGRSDASCHW
jgi:hypothetical protein